MLAGEEYDRVLAEARRRLNRGEDLDSALAFMRSEGFGFIPCCKAVRALLNVDLGEAKRLVHFSRAFAEERHEREAFQAAAAGALDFDDTASE
jgi:ribosomal protein L7/L12